MAKRVSEIPDPLFFLSIYDEHVRDRVMDMYPWQVELMLQFAQRYEDKVNRMSLCANNGSGKSTYSIAPCATWLADTFAETSCVVTSASGSQLDRQTGRAITRLCNQVNKVHGEKVWECKYRQYTQVETQSVIFLYATDEPGKAEGYHQLVPDGEFAIFVDEAKTVEQPIFEAISRCNGVTRRLDVSSPGMPQGHFYNTQLSDRWWHRKVTYRNCPHISEDEVDEARIMYGENSPIFRSMYLAEFTSTDEQIVMRHETICNLFKTLCDEIDMGYGRHGGLDISAGGDENVFSVFDENIHIGLECFRFDDTLLTTRHIKKMIQKYNVPPRNINADDGHVGKAVIDNLWADGFKVNRVVNQSRAFNNRVYSNRGAEMWFNFARYAEEMQIRLIDDKLLRNQLASRYYKESGKTICLESKQQARAKGHSSPDRADATVLAWSDKPYGKWMNRSSSDKAKIKRMYIPRNDELVEKMDELKYKKSNSLGALHTHANTAYQPYIDRYLKSQKKIYVSTTKSLIP